MTKSHWIGLTITWPGHMIQGPLYAVPPKPRHAAWWLELNCEHLHLLDIECWLSCWTLYLLQLILLDFVIIATYIVGLCNYCNLYLMDLYLWNLYFVDLYLQLIWTIYVSTSNGRTCVEFCVHAVKNLFYFTTILSLLWVPNKVVIIV